MVGKGLATKRKEGRARRKSTSEDYGNDIRFFSLSSSCSSLDSLSFFLSRSFPPFESTDLLFSRRSPFFLLFSLSLSFFSPTIFRCYSWRETFWERIKTLIYSAIDHGRAKLYRSINNRKIIPREARLALSFVDSTCNRIIDTVR